MPEAPDTQRRRVLVRHSDQGMVGGVCVGLADYFDVDINLVRAAFIAASVAAGVGPALYLALWVLLDDASPVVPRDEPWKDPTAVLSVDLPEESHASPMLETNEFPLP